MSGISPDRFRDVFGVMERLVEDRWGIPVRIRDVTDPFTGDLDGAEIQVDFDLEAEDALFILVHLFGHTAQWNTDPAARAIGTYPGPWTSDKLEEVRVYEQTACRYSLQLCHDAGIHDLDQWLSDFAACDYAYLHHFYTSGEKRPFRSFWTDGNACLTPLPIPSFTPTRWLSRDGIVI